jgi:hypothetical protein
MNSEMMSGLTMSLVPVTSDVMVLSRLNRLRIFDESKQFE